MADTAAPTSSRRGATAPIVIEGIPGSPGLAIGPALVVDTRRPGVVRRHVPKHAADEEITRFEAAVATAAKGLREVAEKLPPTARAESSILEAYTLMVEDESLRDEVERHVRIDLQCAEWALDNAIRAMSDQLRSTEDHYLSERSHDFDFIGDRILMALTGQQRSAATALFESDEPAIVIAHDLSPAETAGFTHERVKAMVTEVGTRTSHTSILARALEIPAAVGVRDVLSKVGTGDLVVVDGFRGRVVISPTDEMVKEALARVERKRLLASAMRDERDRPATTRCGVSVELRANIELPSETAIALDHGAGGIGLYRTEFLYVDRAEPPSEEEQTTTYRKVLEAMAPRAVTLRTFDIGGDKFVSAFQVPADMNPALGLRAVRLGLARPELFMVQLRAMVRASAHGDMRIMIPMIASVSELRAVRALFDRAVHEVDRVGYPRAAHIPLGVMVEVPSAAIMANELAREAEFLSIGTNDLVQYSLAVDRGSPGLAYLATPFDPAILRLIRGVVEAGQRHSRDVSVCGTMASDPLAAVLLVGMGVRTLSLEAAAISKVKAAIGRFTLAEAREVAEQAVGMATASDVDDLIAHAFGVRLADLLDDEG
jgi:phosphoenolpyruvate-protein phosphotransferase (PTS system enzyme I)